MLEFVGFTEQAVYRGMEKELATVEKETLSLQDSNLGDHIQVKNNCLVLGRVPTLPSITLPNLLLGRVISFGVPCRGKHNNVRRLWI